MASEAMTWNVPETQVQEAEEKGLPNKFIYPEFAGFRGEERLNELLEAILPLSLYRTWLTIERRHAYGNDCYQGLTTIAKQARRSERTVQRDLASLTAKGLLVLRVEQKVFVNQNGSLRKKAVVVKDFAGLYALAHEYYEWCQSEGYIEPERDFVELIRLDPQLEAKLRRFEDYRRLLYHHSPERKEQLREEDRWFVEYNPEGEEQVKNVKEQQSGQNTTLLSSEMPTETPTKVSQERTNENDYNKSLKGYSFDSGANPESGGKASAKSSMVSQKPEPVARDYTKEVSENKTSTTTEANPTNQPSSVQENTPARPTSNKRERAEMHQDVRRARQAMAAAEFSTLGRGAAKNETLPPPPKCPIARSFTHEVAGVFGDLNEKSSITRVERCIEEAGVQHPAEILRCLVRAYGVARDTAEEKIRHRNPKTGMANRMPLFCSMVERFLQAYASGGKWEYSWQNLENDLAADDRLGLWLSEHRALLVEQKATSEQELQTETVEQEPVTEVKQEELTSAEVSVNEESSDEARSTQRRRHSQSVEEREARARLARKVMMRLINMGVPIKDPLVDGEHYACGCPLYHAPVKKQLCALCYPDPSWSQETLAMIRSIVELEAREQLPQTTGWGNEVHAYEWVEYLVSQLAEQEYSGISVSTDEHGGYYRVVVEDAETGEGYFLTSANDALSIVAAACDRTLDIGRVDLRE